MRRVGGDSGSCLPHPEHPSYQPTSLLGPRGADWEAEGCWAVLAPAWLSAAQSWAGPANSPLLPTQTNPRLPNASAPTAPGKNTVPHPSAPWPGRKALPSRAQGSGFPDKQSKRRAVKGSAEVPSLQIFPVSSHPCLPHHGDAAWSTSGVPNLVGISSSTHLAFSPQS